jgi:ATP/maltotriose-dependent transcriptional regulator MalT
MPARFADIAFCLGDFDMARELYQQSERISREVGFRRYQVHCLCHLGLIASIENDRDRALELGQEALRIALQTSQPRSQAYAHLTLGHAYFGLGRLDEAATAYQQSATIRLEIGQPHLAVESVAGLARVALARGDTSAALARVEAILTSLQTRSLDGTSERLRIYLTCYQALTAAHDPRAAAILERATGELTAQVEATPDETLRRRLLENVPWHRELWTLVH